MDYTAAREERLFVDGNGVSREVPPMQERPQIIQEYHATLRHVGPDKIFTAIAMEFWWPTMRQDVIEHISKCPACAASKYKFSQGVAMRPTDRPRAPFEGWSIDLITDLDPAVDGYRHCIVAICCFSKWVEIFPIKNRLSKTIADWLMTELVPRFGKPRWIRVDRGKEFAGDFKALCQAWGIT